MSFPLFNQLERRFADPAGLFTRREALHATLVGAAGLLLSDAVARGGPAAPKAKGKRVVVIGAGLAGLAAAYELHSVGYDVMVVEGRDRLGGRVHTLDNFIRNKTVEAGGEMIGLNHPAWAAYARRFRLTLVPIPHDPQANQPVVLDGERLSDAEARTLWKELREGLAQINADAAHIHADEPWKSPNARALDDRSTADWIGSLDLSDRVKRAMSIQLTAINGVLPAQQSYLANLAMVKGGGVEKYWTETDALRCEGGNQQLPEEIADEIGPGHFILNQPVKAVRMDDRQAIVSVADGRNLEADDVILAAPVSVWNRIEFDPPLPPGLAPQMGVNTKFLTALKSRFWENDGHAARSLTDGPVSLTWEDTATQPEEGGVCLTAYAGGPTAEEAMGWSQGERREKYLLALEQLYPKLRDRYVESRFINWMRDPLARGTYSFPAPGQVLAHGPTLHEGLGRLHFAGEHCCYAFIGYMEGALQSGVRLAKKLAVRDGVAKA